MISKGGRVVIRVSVLYPRYKEAFFNLDYYTDAHLALVWKKLKPFGLKRVEIEAGIDETTPYCAIGSLLFETLQQYQSGFAEIGQELLEDIPNYTNIDPVVQVSEYQRFS